MGAINTCEEADVEEQENLENWKVQFLEEQEIFEEDGIEVDAFGLDEWDG